MDSNLTHALRTMVSIYGWRAVLAELAQLSLDDGKHTNADLLLQVSSELSKSQQV